MRWREIVEGALDMANAAKKTAKSLTERYSPAFVQKLKEGAAAAEQSPSYTAEEMIARSKKLLEAARKGE